MAQLKGYALRNLSMNVLFPKLLYYVRGVTMKRNVINVSYRDILLYYFKNGNRAAEVRRKIGSVYEIDEVTERVCQKWFYQIPFRRFLHQ